MESWGSGFKKGFARRNRNVMKKETRLGFDKVEKRTWGGVGVGVGVGSALVVVGRGGVRIRADRIA